MLLASQGESLKKPTRFRGQSGTQFQRVNASGFAVRRDLFSERLTGCAASHQELTAPGELSITSTCLIVNQDSRSVGVALLCVSVSKCGSAMQDKTRVKSNQRCHTNLSNGLTSYNRKPVRVARAVHPENRLWLVRLIHKTAPNVASGFRPQ